jgi:hypothetical protein
MTNGKDRGTEAQRQKGTEAQRQKGAEEKEGARSKE